MKFLVKIKDIVIFLVFMLLAAYASPLLLFTVVTNMSRSEFASQNYYLALSMMSIVIALLIGMVIFVGVNLAQRMLNLKPAKASRRK